MQITTERNRYIVTGAIGLILLIAAVSIGIKASFGAFDGGYELQGSFAAAGQGLAKGSDVKIRGVNIGEVKSIELVENRALIKMRISDGQEIPVSSQAVIRPKTLFGEKFVDILPGDAESTGPFLGDGGTIDDTLGGFELERVLSDTYPVLLAVDPAELAVVLDELANAADGLGDVGNRLIVNSDALAQLQVSNDAELRSFLGDIALLAEELDAISPTLLDGARILNETLPKINARSADLNSALIQASRLSSDVADLLENNTDFTRNALTNGSKPLQILFDGRGQLQPLLLGLEQYGSTLAQAIRIEVGDGTMMAAIKNLVHAPVALPLGGAAATEAPTAPTTPGAAGDLLDDVDGLLGGTLDPLTDPLVGLLLGGGE